MHRELVEERRWISERRFLHALSYCTLLPGPEAQQLAIYLGWLLNGTRGGLVAGILFVLPGFVALMILAAIYARWGSTTAVAAVFAGLAPGVLAIVAQALVRIGRRALSGPLQSLLAVVSFLALFAFSVPFPVVVGAALLTGYILGQTRAGILPATGVASSEEARPPLLADDALHGVKPNWRRAIRILALGLGLWSAPILLAAVAGGRNSVFVDQGLFFSGAAVVTFGGAYAVLSYVAHQAVDTYQWLAPGEMINGLALAESTPGPLIMVVQFVGFLGAFRDPGGLDPWLAAVLGATMVVWVTFVPCFLFVFLGAPHVESLRENVRLTSALAAVTASVVGVIANLSVYFAIHTLFDRTRPVESGPLQLVAPVWSSVDLRALAITVLAFALVFRTKLGVLSVLALCALAGASLYLITGG